MSQGFITKGKNEFNYELHMLPGDSLKLDGITEFRVGEVMSFKSKDEVLDFLMTAQKREVVVRRYPFLWCIFGGNVETVREDRYFKKPPVEITDD